MEATNPYNAPTTVRAVSDHRDSAAAGCPQPRPQPRAERDEFDTMSVPARPESAIVRVTVPSDPPVLTPDAARALARLLMRAMNKRSQTE